MELKLQTLSMARFKNKKKVFVKSVSTKKQANMDHSTGDKIPRSFVFSRCKLPGPLKQLQADLRKLLLPDIALKLKLQLQEEDHNNGFNPISTFASAWSEFARNVSGEWDGHGADFTREECPIELPENVVPAAYREWEVSNGRLNAPLVLPQMSSLFYTRI